MSNKFEKHTYLNLRKIILLFVVVFFISAVFLIVNPASAATNVSNLNLSIEPAKTNSTATWEISFTIPEDTDVGHLLVSLGGYQADLSNASLSVNGLSGGTANVGKTNPNCLSNCDDVKYILDKPVAVKKGTQIKLTLSKVKNPEKVGQAGVEFIEIYSTKYPNKDLVFSSAQKLIELEEGDGSEDEDNEDEDNKNDITTVLINEQFFKEDSRTTKFLEIKDPTKVINVTFDLVGKVKVVFMGEMDLSTEEAVHFIANLADYATFDFMYFWINRDMVEFFGLPMEITFYELPLVWDADIILDKRVLTKDDLSNFKSVLVDKKPMVSFVTKESGGYNVIPHFELEIEDNKLIKSENNTVTFSGRIADPEAGLKIGLNGDDLEPLNTTIDEKTGKFNFTIQLTEGTNLIEIQPTGNYGEVESVTKLVQYQVPSINNIKEAEQMNPLYIVVGVLFVLAVLLVIGIVYLLKKK